MKNKLTNTPGRTKLSKLKKWLTINETAGHLSFLFNEKVSEADVLRLGLDGQLQLSIFLVNKAKARLGKVASRKELEEIKRREAEDLTTGIVYVPSAHKLGDSKHYKDIGVSVLQLIEFDNVITFIEGIWDLPMIGNERFDVEHKYQQLTEGVEVTQTSIDGTFLEGEDKLICQLQEKSDPKLIETQDGEKLIGYFYPANGLPEDSVLVVRTLALANLQQRLQQEVGKIKPLEARAEKTYLNILGSMLEIINGNHGDVKFKSETTLREFLSQKYNGFQGLTERTLADKFALAKKAIREELD